VGHAWGIAAPDPLRFHEDEHHQGLGDFVLRSIWVLRRINRAVIPKDQSR
jgi:hypothetical protein